MRDAEAALRLPQQHAMTFIAALSVVAAVDEFNLTISGHIGAELGNLWLTNRTRELVSYCVSQGYCPEETLALLDKSEG